MVYVDSGSTDNSVEIAHQMGADVVALDMSTPFTAARARNEGFSRLRQAASDCAFVQFVDGDCEILPEWIVRARDFLHKHQDVGVASGRLRERFPDRSIYNMLCDNEWNSQVGEARYCGGIAMVRVDAFKRVGGFKSDLIAGEEPELCVRLRASGWRIWRLDAEMALHDAAMLRFGQWWRRAIRGGYAFAEGAALHGAPPERHWVRESRSARLWGGFLPLTVVVALLIWGVPGLFLVLIYPLQVVRLGLRGIRSPRENWWCAFFMVLGKFPEMIGQLRFVFNQGLGRVARIIEYK